MNIDIDQLTLGQVKQIQSVATCASSPEPRSSGPTGVMSELTVGKYCLVRCRDAGVHAGVVVAQEGRSVALEESRRLYRWHPAGKDKLLSAVARDGLDHEKSLVSTNGVLIVLTEDCEIAICTEKAEDSIRNAPENCNG